MTFAVRFRGDTKLSFTKDVATNGRERLVGVWLNGERVGTQHKFKAGSSWEFRPGCCPDGEHELHEEFSGVQGGS